MEIIELNKKIYSINLDIEKCNNDYLYWISIIKHASKGNIKIQPDNIYDTVYKALEENILPPRYINLLNK